MMVMKVSDNGKGIPDELKELIFDKFYQAENQALRKPKGSGLGLAISRRIVLLHSGHIYAETNEGGGAVFVVKLPLDKVNTDIHEQKSIDSG
jgi:signal transduction histidine kinase